MSIQKLNQGKITAASQIPFHDTVNGQDRRASAQDLVDLLGELQEVPPHTHPISDIEGLQSALDGKQPTLVSGSNIKTINGIPVLGSGNIEVSGGGGGGGANLSYDAATRTVISDSGTDAVLPLMSSGQAGLVPASGGGTTNFLRADGTFAAPPGGGGSLTDGDKGDITVSASGTAWAIDTGVVSNAKLATAPALSVKANGTNATAALTDVAAGTDGHVLRRSGTTLGFGQVATGGIADLAVTSAKIATGIDATKLADGSVSNAEFQRLDGVTSGIQAQLDAKLNASLATAITDTKATPIDADKLILLNSEAADAAVITTVGGVRTRLNNQVVGSTLGTSGSVALDLAALTGTVQRIAATGNLTFTTSNRAAGRSFELRIAAGGSSRTLTWPAGWVAFGAALPTSLGSGKVLRVAISCGGTADTDIDAAAAESA